MQARILVVEDDPLQQMLLAAALSANGYHVDAASDGLSAVRRIRDGRYDLVLLDYSLPEIDGLATAGLVHDLMDDDARPGLIALTAAPYGVLGRELRSGQVFDQVVAKTVDLPGLLDVVARHVRPAASRAASPRTDCDSVTQECEAAKARILVVEYDHIQGTAIKSVLAVQGYDIETAHDGLSAVRKLRKRTYDLAIIDYDLPEIDGFAAARLVTDLLAEPARPRLIAVTCTPGDLRQRDAQCGPVFADIVAKSAGAAVLLATVAQQLETAPTLAARRTALPASPQ